MTDLAWIEGPVDLRDGRQVRIRAVRADDEASMLAHPMLAVFHDAFGGRASNHAGLVDIRVATCDWPQARARFDPEPTDPTDSGR